MKTLNISIVFSAIIVFIVSSWTLNKGFGVGDEAYFLQLLQYQPSNFSIISAHKFFQGWFGGNILSVRWFVFATSICSAYLFSLSVFYFFQNAFPNRKQNVIIASLSIIALYIFYMPIGLGIDYNSINRILTLCSIACMLIAMKKGNKFWYLYIISGILISLLFFIKITNSPLIFLLPLVIYIYCKYQKWNSLKILMFYFSGVIISFLYYFIWIESIYVYFENIKKLSEITIQETSPTGHNLSMLLVWIFNACKYILLQTIPFVLVFLFYHFKAYNYISHKIVQYSIHAILFLYIIFIVNFEIRANLTGIATYIPFLGILVCIVLVNYKKYLTHELIISLFLMIVPMLLAFGSNVSFKHKCAEYFIFIVPLIYIAFLRFPNRLYIYVFSLFLGIYTLNFVSKLFIPNWSGIVPIKQTVLLKEHGINQSIYVDTDLFKEIQEYSSMVPKEAYYTTNYYRLKGFAYLNNNIPLDFNYQPVDSVIVNSTIKYLQDSLKTLYIVENNQNPLPSNFFSKIQDKVKCDISEEKGKFFNVYTCNSNK